jgi:hypothetical protein
MMQMVRAIAAEAQAHIKDITTVPAQAVEAAHTAILTDKDCPAWTWELTQLLTGLRTDVDTFVSLKDEAQGISWLGWRFGACCILGCSWP